MIVPRHSVFSVPSVLKKSSPLLAFTCGDPAGVGPEIIATWLAAHPAEAADVAVIGPARWLETLPACGAKIAVGLEDFVATPGQPDGAGALVAWAAMERAAAGTKSGEFSGVVTGPVSKERLAAVGYEFPGQTEFFAARWGGEPVMCFCGGKLRVALATWHVPLCEVPQLLGPQLLHRTIAAADRLARAFGSGPCRAGSPDPATNVVATLEERRGSETPPYISRIGVCGLNPHAGENGLLGEEERDLLNPTLTKLRGEFPGLSLCQPADTLFARALRGEFDVIVALYHDQGLAPLKVIDFDDSVNVTLGLPFVRTSPDHGTAFGIAGKGTANATSFTNAVTVARRLIARKP
ncbi:MAG: 4-hydroxythreonine-4-phosphate dehydrogenase PdxA [Candidatus Didemnitutus sp.]|nr:4-hydroxythreonine-4-phosphate dehydrogenase PdxA [Candidatus Didemnitutus sp.]